MANGRDGSYLLRASASNPGEYSLSVRYVIWSEESFQLLIGVSVATIQAVTM